MSSENDLHVSDNGRRWPDRMKKCIHSPLDYYPNDNALPPSLQGCVHSWSDGKEVKRTAPKKNLRSLNL